MSAVRDVLSHLTQLKYVAGGVKAYPNCADTEKVLHLSSGINWVFENPKLVFACSSSGPEMAGEASIGRIYAFCPRYRGQKRVLVSNGTLEMIILTNETFLAIKNKTLDGASGFQAQPVTRCSSIGQAVFNASGQKGRDDPQGVFGVQHHELDLMWASKCLDDHM